MGANTSPIFPAISKLITPVTFVNADGTAYKDVVTGLATGNAAGTLLERIAVTSDDTSARVLKIALKVSGTDYQIGEVNIPIGTGTDGSARALNLLALLATAPDISNIVRPDGSIVIPPAAILRVGPKVAVTAAKTMTLVPFGWDY